jgi:hypothetical protein
MISGPPRTEFDRVPCAMEAQSGISILIDEAIFRKKASQAFNSAYAALVRIIRLGG